MIKQAADDKCRAFTLPAPPANGLAHIILMPAERLALTFHPSHNGASGGWFLSTPDGEQNGIEPC